MCKHKSGGMSKPSGATNQQGALPGRTTTASSCPSHNCPSETNTALATATCTNSIQDQLRTNSILLLDPKDKHSASSSISMAVIASEDNFSDEMFSTTQAKSHLPHNVADSKELETHSHLPSTGGERIESPRPDSLESDEELATEQSPMLLNQASSAFSTPSKVWNATTQSSAKAWENGITNRKFSQPYSNCTCTSVCGNVQESSYPVSCDKISSFRSYKALSSFQVPTSYIPPCGSGGCTGLLDSAMETVDSIQLYETDQCSCCVKSGKRWLFARHKCKSLETDTNPISIHNSVVCQRSSSLACSLEESRTLESAEKSSLVESSNSGLSVTYSTSTVNTDAVAGPSGLQRPNSIHWEIGTKDNGEDEFRCRSFSLTPTVNFAVFESESSSETEDMLDGKLSSETNEKTLDISGKEGTQPFQIPVSPIGRVIPVSPSAAQLSLASSFGDSGAPMCKICHMTAKENDPLISPCRCSGTMQYIHCGCLMRWLEVSSKRSRKPASCELCQYQYHWHKKFKVRHWQFPHCSRRDKVLHFLFFISMMVMIACATITIMCFKQDKGTKVDPDRTELTQSEIVTLVCGVLFFLAFFVAMYVEVKSRNTIYKLLVKFIYLNQQWYIDEYEKKENGPVAV